MSLGAAALMFTLQPLWLSDDDDVDELLLDRLGAVVEEVDPVPSSVGAAARATFTSRGVTRAGWRAGRDDGQG